MAALGGARSVGMLGRIGALLLLAGVALTVAVVAIALAGSPVGLAQRNAPPLTIGEEITLLAIVAFGLGTGTISIAGSAPVRARATRIGLGLAGLGLLSLAVSSALPSYFGVYAESYPLLFVLLGFVLVAVGVPVTGVSLARSPGWLRVSGATLLAGLVAPFVVALALQAIGQPGPLGEVLLLLVPVGLGILGVVVWRRSGAGGREEVTPRRGSRGT
jgi:hypothetical protein